jgi:hypothetical protein
VHRNKAGQTPSFTRFALQENSMYANGAFKNPFADFDFSKIAGEFKFPMINVETIVEATRKNFAALTTANTAVESMKRVAQRQGDMVRAAMEGFSSTAATPGRHRRGEAPSRSTSSRRATRPPSPTQGADRALQQGGHAEAFAALGPPRLRADRRGQGCDRQK